MAPTDRNILASVADLVSKTRQSGVSLIGSVSDRMAEEIADVNIVMISEAEVHLGLNLMVGSSCLGIDDVIGTAACIGQGNIRKNLQGHWIDTIFRNDVSRK